LASTAARGASTVEIDALAQQAFVRGYNCPTLKPELRKTRRSLGDDCHMRDMVKIAEQTEADYSSSYSELHRSSRKTSVRRSTEVENEIRGDNQKKSHLEIQGQPMMKEILEDKYKLPVWY
jgi:hypothetical protein